MNEFENEIKIPYDLQPRVEYRKHEWFLKKCAWLQNSQTDINQIDYEIKSMKPPLLYNGIKSNLASNIL